MYGVEPGTGLPLLLERLARPYDPERVAAALLGLPARSARQLVGILLATSDEAEALLHAMPTIVRSMAIATTDQPERCVGEIRGPVLWGETMSARSASAGDPGLFVCATTTKAYDTDENRVLKAALAAINRAGRNAEPVPDETTSELVKRARHNGQQAGHLLEHQTLAQVPVVRPNGRALRRTRAGSRRHTYRPALALLRRAGDPAQAAHLEVVADRRTRLQLDLVAAALLHVDRATGTQRLLRTDHGGLTAGILTYHHPESRVGGEQVAGVRIGDVLLDVPEPLDAAPDVAEAAMRTRAPDLHVVVATREADVEAAVARALG